MIHHSFKPVTLTDGNPLNQDEMLRNDNIAALIGTTAYDCDGEKIGKVGQVYVDATDGLPCFASVHTGLFGRHESFVPIEQAEWDGGDDVRVPFTKDVIKGAPRADGLGDLNPSFGRDRNPDAGGAIDGDTVGGRHAASGKEVRADHIDDADTGAPAGRHLDVGDARPTAPPECGGSSR